MLGIGFVLGLRVTVNGRVSAFYSLSHLHPKKARRPAFHSDHNPVGWVTGTNVAPRHGYKP